MTVTGFGHDLLRRWLPGWRLRWHPAQLLLKPGEAVAPYMEPAAFARATGQTLTAVAAHWWPQAPAAFVLGLLQYKQKVLLEAFLNSHDLGLDGRPLPAGAGFPLEQTGAAACLEYLAALQELAGLPFQRLSQALGRAQSGGPLVPPEAVADILAAFYADFPAALEHLQLALPARTQPAPLRLDLADYLTQDAPYRAAVTELAAYVRASLAWALKDFVVHGSLATVDYVIGSSDLDTFAVVRPEVCADAAQLLRLRAALRPVWRFLYRIDPLQHHGVMLTAEQDLAFYAQPFFPLAILDHAVSLLTGPAEPWTIAERPAEFERRHFLFQSVHFFRFAYATSYDLSRTFELKFFLSTLLLLPALYYQAWDGYAYKKFSFPRLRQDFPAAATAAEALASWAREHNAYGLPNPTAAAGLAELLGSAGDEPDLLSFHRLIRNLPAPGELRERLGPAFRHTAWQFAETLLEAAQARWGEPASPLDWDRCAADFDWGEAPEPRTPADYRQAYQEAAALLAPAAPEVLQFGEIGVSGISDLDLVLVAARPEQAERLNGVPAQWERLAPPVRYVCYHPPSFIIGPQHLSQLGELYPITQWRTLALTDDPTRPAGFVADHSPAAARLLALVEIACAYFFWDTLAPLLRGRVEERFALLRLNGLKHSIRILRQAGRQSPAWEAFVQQVADLRAGWFAAAPAARRTRLLQALSAGLGVQLELVEALRQELAGYVQAAELSAAEAPARVVAVLDNQVYFATGWTPDLALEWADNGYHDGQRVIPLLPAEFAALLACYSQPPGRLARALQNRLAHSLTDVRASEAVIQRRALLNDHLEYLAGLGLTWGGLPHLAVRLDVEPAETPGWLQRAGRESLGRPLTSLSWRVSAALAGLRQQLEAGQIAPAREALAEIVQGGSENGEAHYLYAFALHSAGADPQRALAAYTLALEYGFDEFWVRYNRGALELTLGDLGAAQADLERAAHLQPDHTGAAQLLKETRKRSVLPELGEHQAAARAGVSAGQYAAARAAAEAWLALEPEAAEAHYLLAVSLHLSGAARETALRHYTRALALGADEFWTRYNRGLLLREAGDLEAALVDLERAAQLQPDHPDIQLLVRQTVAMRLQQDLAAGRYAAAIPAAERLCQAEPAVAEWHYDLAVCLQLAKADPARALRHYAEALALGFDEFWVRYNRAVLFREQGAVAAAQADWERAAQLNPEHPGLRAALADLRLQQARGWVHAGDYAGAGPLLERLVVDQPGLAEAHYLLALSLQHSGGDRERARRAYAEALRLGFDEFWVRYNHGALLLQAGEPEAAQAEFERAMALQPEHAGARTLWAAAREARARRAPK